MRSARLRDIAESAGCSVAVASHVVNGSAGNISCSPALRERILRKAAELGYAPQHAGLALRSRRAGAIGLYVPPTPDASLSGAYEARVFAGVERVALERGLDVLVVGGPDAASGARICLAKLASRRIDGIVLLRVPAAARWARSFAGLDAVAVDYAGAAPLDTVVCDVRDAAALAVGELLRLGHRRIAFLGPVDGALPAVAGFRRALAAHGLPDDPRWNLRPPRGSGFPARLGKARLAAQRFAATPAAKRPTALVADTDETAIAFLDELRARGLSCPRDVSLASLGDSALGRLALPALSSVVRPLADMGAAAALRLLERIDERGLAEPPPSPPRPLATAAARAGRRGRPPAAVAAALAAESAERAAQDAAAAAAAPAPPPRARWTRPFEPSFVARDSTAAPPR